MTVQRLGPSFGENAYRPVTPTSRPASWGPNGDFNNAGANVNSGATAPIIPSRSTQAWANQTSNAVPTVLTAPNGPLVYWKLVELNRQALESANNTGGSRQPWYHGVVNMLFGQQLLDADEASVLAPISRTKFLGSFPPSEQSDVNHALRMFERANVITDNGMQVQLTYAGYGLRKKL